MLKSLKRSLAGVSLLAALCSPTNANADYQLKEPNLSSPRSTRLTGSEFSTYGVFDYGFEDGFFIDYDLTRDYVTHDWDRLNVSLNYGELNYNPSYEQQDFIDGMLELANSPNGTQTSTPLDGIMNAALRIEQINDHYFGRFKLNDIFVLFRSFNDLFEVNRSGNHTEGEADITLNGKIDFQQYSNMHFRRNRLNCFLEHGTRAMAEANANANMSYNLDGEGVSFGTPYDDLLDRSLELSIKADFRAEILRTDSYRIGIENRNNRYGLGLLVSDFTRIRGTENADISVNSSLSEAFTMNRIAYLDADERNTLNVEDGRTGLIYLFHSGTNGMFWHAGYVGVEIPDYGTGSRFSDYTEHIELRHDLDFNDPKTLGRLISGDRKIYNSFYLTQNSESDSDFQEDEFVTPRLDYGLTVGLNEGPIRPVLSVSHLRDSRFFFNFVLPYAVFNVSSDLTMPHHAFLTFDRNNSETLGNFLRTVEENSVMPNSAPNAMNDYARLAAYSNISGPMIALSSENDALAASLFYSRQQKYFLELGITNSSIDSKGVFLRGGVRNFMATVGYSYMDRPNSEYSSQGLIARVSGRSDSLYYSLSASGLLMNFSPGNQSPNDLNEMFRAELLLGGNF